MKENHKNPNFVYKHSQLYDILLARITSGEWKPGDRILSERELSRRYNVSRPTVQETLKQLSDEGYISRRQGRGTFVTDHKTKHKFSRAFTLHEDSAAGTEPLAARLLSYQIIPADGHVRNTLHLDDRSPVIEVLFCLYAGKTRAALQTSYISQILFPFLNRDLIEQNGLYDGMQLFHPDPWQTSETLRAVNLTEEEALALGVKKQDTAICLERISCSGDLVLEYTVKVIKADCFYYRNPR